MRGADVLHIATDDDLAGFDLCGTRQPDGSIKLDGGAVYEDWPKEVELPGINRTYTLEHVKKNLKNRKPLPDDHPGRYIEWGIYV
jgi:hypothetical protein